MVESNDRLRAAIDSALLRHEVRRAAPSSQGHVSHMQFVIHRETVSRDDDDAIPCLVEPAVQCTHCGYCVSFGH